jgi:phosphatidylglycerophosphate synthase
MTAGERWAADELLALRASAFRPAAWQRFLSASFRRATESRRARPNVARQARAWAAAALLVGHAARRAARILGVASPSARAWTAWSLVSAAMLDWHLGMLEGPDGERRDRLRAADALSLARAELAPFVAAAGVDAPRSRAAFSALIATGAVTDLLDGRLARRTGETRLGRDTDTVADVTLKLAAARAARQARWLTPTTTRVFATCQVAGIAVVAGTYLRRGRRPARERLAEPRWTAPPLMCGLALAPYAPRIANVLVGTASLTTLTLALRRRALPSASAS